MKKKITFKVKGREYYFLWSDYIKLLQFKKQTK